MSIIPVIYLQDDINAKHSLVFNYVTNAITLEPAIFSRINEISNLEMDWNGYNAIVPNVYTLSHIKSFIRNIGDNILEKIKEENIYANPHGTISVRIGNNGNFINIEFGERYANYYAKINGKIKHKREKENLDCEYIPYEIKQAFNELFAA